MKKPLFPSFAVPAWRGAVLGAALAIAMPLAAHAASAQEQLRSFVGSTQAASGSFSQATHSSSGKPAPVQSGTFSFQRPGKFKWLVAKPFEQAIVSDGKQLFQYDPDLSQVTVRDVNNAIGSSPAQILFGSGSLEQSFNVADLPGRDGLDWLRATPKSPDAGFSRVEIGFKDGLPARLELQDSFGQITQVSFSGMTRNPAFAADAFNFTPPKGADVVRMGAQPADARN